MCGLVKVAGFAYICLQSAAIILQRARFVALQITQRLRASALAATSSKVSFEHLQQCPRMVGYVYFAKFQVCSSS